MATLCQSRLYPPSHRPRIWPLVFAITGVFALFAPPSYCRPWCSFGIFLSVDVVDAATDGIPAFTSILPQCYTSCCCRLRRWSISLICWRYRLLSGCWQTCCCWRPCYGSFTEIAGDLTLLASMLLQAFRCWRRYWLSEALSIPL